jgi:hypothetical protein
VLTPDQLLHEGENLLGSYNIEIARWVNERWIGTVPLLYVVLTDHRLILQPQARKHYEPAVIPGRYIKQVTDVNDDRRRGLLITLKTGHRIGMVAAGVQADTFARNLRTLMVPPSPVRFESELNLTSIQKLITFVENL